MWESDRPSQKELGTFLRGILAIVDHLHPDVVGTEPLNVLDTELAKWADEEGIPAKQFGQYIGQISNEMRQNELFSFYPEVNLTALTSGNGLVLYAKMMPKN